MAPVMNSVAMFSLLLLMMIDVVQCTSLALDAYKYLSLHSDKSGIVRAKELANELAKPDEYYIGSNKKHLIEQIRARISMTQPTIDELEQLYKAKLGDIKWPDSKEFDPDDQEKVKQLLDKLKEPSVWFKNLLQLSDEQNLLKKYYSQVEAYEKLLQEGYEMLSRSPKLASQRPHLDIIKMELNKVKQDFDKGKQFFGHELDILNADMVEHNLGSRFRKDKIYSDYGEVEYSFKRFLMEKCENLIDELLLAESDNDESDVETPQDDEQLKKAKAELRDRRRFRKEQKVGFTDKLYEAYEEEDKEKIRDGLKQAWNYVQEAKLKVKEANKNSAPNFASNSSGSQENQEDPPKVFPPTDIPEPGSQVNLEDLKLTPPVIPIKVGTQSTQEDNRPFWKKKRYNIPASLGGLVFAGWLLDLQNKIPQMIGWGSKEDDASTKVNPPNSTTTDTSTDATTHQVEYLTVVIIVLAVLALLVVGFAVFLVRCKNGTSDLEGGEASHKSQSASTKASTTKGTGASSTSTRSASSNTKLTSEVKSKKSRSSTSVSTKTKSKRLSPKVA